MDTTEAYNLGHKHGEAAAIVGSSIRKVIKFAFVGFIAKLALDTANEKGLK